MVLARSVVYRAAGMTRARRRKEKARKLGLALRRGEPKALWLEAVRLLAAGKHAECAGFAARARRSATDDSGRAAAHDLVVEALFRRAIVGSDENRLIRLGKVLQIEPNQPRLRFHRAVAGLRAGTFTRALVDLEAVAAAEPDHKAIAPLRALAAACTGQPDPGFILDGPDRAAIDAVRGFLVAGIAATDAPEPWLSLSRLAAGRRVDPDVLDSHAAQLSGKASGMLSAYAGVASLTNGDRRSALIDFHIALESGLKQRWLVENCLKLLRVDLVEAANAGQWDRAVAMIPWTGRTGDRILDETASAVLFHRGWEAARSTQWDAAERLWRHADAFAGSRALSQNLALAAETLGRWSDAANAWRKVIRRLPRSPKHPEALTDGQVAAIWLHLARCCRLDEGRIDFDDARRCAHKALKLGGNNCALRLAAGAELADLGDAEGARRVFERILDSGPDNAEALEALGLLLLEVWPREAAAVLERLVEVDSGRPGAREALDSALAGMPIDMIDFDREEVSAGNVVHGAFPLPKRRPWASLVELRTPPALPARGEPSFDVMVHPSDMVLLALESILSRFPADMDFREPSLPMLDRRGSGQD